MSSTIHVTADPESLAKHACHWLVERIQEHCAASPRPFVLALSGGSTPKRLYQLLGELPDGMVDWSRVVLVWGDERNVPADHADSNFRMVRESLLDSVAIPSSNVLAVPNPGGSASAAATEYEALLAGVKLDCVLLGIGDDVHTASLFPGTKALSEQERSVVANRVDKLDCWRITFTAPFINSAKHVAFLIAGSTKQAALHSLWHGQRDVSQFPSQLIEPSGGKLWFLLDQDALGANAVPAGAEVVSCAS